ncbi:hypothetical protein N9W11_01300 [Psychrosphaera haliotis]|nr:hypothetical protein [Psychrosphaera haliotis]
MKIINIINKLSTARMEYQTTTGSVLNKFVVPFFVDKLDLRNVSHSVALAGSRGSGKSTYIQYFSQSTRFDKNLSQINDEEFDCILFYWKPDISYCQGLKSNWLGDDALRFFSVHTALSLINEVGDLIENISNHFPDIITSLNDNGNFWKAISRVTKEKIDSLNLLYKWVIDYKYDISTRLNPINTEGLLSVEPKQMFSYLIENLRLDYSRFENTTFKIFVDEFELLTAEQQKLINTYRKESNKLINWNVAYKLNSKISIETTSNQWLQAPDDYSEENLDSYIENNYRIFAAEIFILTLQNAGLSCDVEELTPCFLGSRDNVAIRKQKAYQDKVISVIDRILPMPSVKEISTIAFEKSSVQSKLSTIFKSFQYSNAITDKILEDISLSITILGIYKQISFDQNLISDYALGKCDDANIRKIKDKIHTFEFNTLLSLNLQHASFQLPVYAGFERFITMTTPNIRHFKEVCLSALKQSDDFEANVEYTNISDIKPISYLGMQLGAISTSSALVKEVISYPPHGKKLSQLVNRMGELFRISQKSSYQSEPERDIFTFNYDYAGADEDLEKFLSSALSWRVLVEDDSRRIKDEKQITNKEFQLNPIYAPKFGISYRKKRGITLTLEQFKGLVAGNSDDFVILKKEYQKKWKAEENDGTEEVSGVQGLLL